MRENSKTEEKRTSVESQVNKSIQEEISAKTDVVELVKKIKLVELLSKACLKKYHLILLPLLLLRRKQSKKEEELISLSTKGQVTGPRANRQPSIPRDSDFPKNEDESQDVRSSWNPAFERQKQEFLQAKRLYDALKHVLPKNSIEAVCNNQILKNLSLIFEQD